ncbi:MBL fold metallo-hydrolase [Lentilactobacillus kisonensis]|uniref:MBL fold metallo-hydrolase n=1 Tax=Lentilactobacillus kisonensis TaxID=481722 RepID=UPI0006CFDBA9|nr:MBL fold metallo-hydrolase [Lentilactobacillus kisonensis]
MIKVKVFGSGSSGNCYLLDDGTSQLLIEAGIAYKHVEQEMDFDLSRVQGMLISHEHTDHSKYIKQFVQRTAFSIYATQGTLNALNLSGIRYEPLTELGATKIGDWIVTAFPVKHDAAEPAGFLIIDSMGERLLYVTDTYFVKYRFNDINYMLVEMNYNQQIAQKNVDKGILNYSLRNRILTSHFEMKNSLDFIKSNLSPSLKWVELIHLSDNNSNEELFKEKTQVLTGVPVLVAPKRSW